MEYPKKMVNDGKVKFASAAHIEKALRELGWIAEGETAAKEVKLGRPAKNKEEEK